MPADFRRRQRMDAVASGTIGHYSFEEKRRRIFAIMAASSGNLVEWFDFYIYSFTTIYFAPSFFPEVVHDDAAVPVLGARLRHRLPDAPDRRLDVREDRRPARPQDLAGDLRGDDVRRLAAGRDPAHVPADRLRRAAAAAAGAHDAGPVGGRRIRRHGHLPQRGGAARRARLLLVVPVRHAHRRPVARRAGRRHPAAVPRPRPN